MGTYADQILGSDSGSEGSDLFFAHMNAIEKQVRKGKKRAKRKDKKKLRKLEKQLRVLEQEQERVTELEKKLRKLKKRKKDKRGKGRNKKKLKEQIEVLDQAYQQQKLWVQEVLANIFLKILGSANLPVNWLPSQSQTVLELPAPRDKK